MANCNNTLEYKQEFHRMCETYSGCRSGCPLKYKPCRGVEDISEESIEAVQKWSDEHPKLKPCPICGSPAEITARPESGDAFFVCCTKTGCIEMNAGFGNYQQAAEAWNRRIGK